MKLRVTFKTPDVVENAIRGIISSSELPVDDLESEIAIIQNLVSKWFKYGEYATIEVDTETDTATVVKINT